MNTSEVFRKEIKYPISVAEFSQLNQRLKFLVQPDPYSGDAGYCVRSLYFDSVKDHDLFDTLDGKMEKRKIRLRFYPPKIDSILLEYKCKSGSDGVKRSIKISKEDALSMMWADYSFLLDYQGPLAHKLYARLMTGGYHPKVIVEYNRMAYVYPVSNTRLTFDSAVRASFVINSFFDETPGMIPAMAPDMGVLEVKYDYFLVGLLKEVLEPVNALAKANSKYAMSRFIF
ncbi:MAG: polyphosphate polymerase domain-containing protein [Christensenellales bacterium]|jgi:hypothetical protein